VTFVSLQISRPGFAVVHVFRFRTSDRTPSCFAVHTLNQGQLPTDFESVKDLPSLPSHFGEMWPLTGSH
jgi:hypothetical protein